MKRLLDYLLYALFGHNVTYVTLIPGKRWIITIEGEVRIVLDEDDLAIIHELYKERSAFLDNEERARYMKIFQICV